MDDTKKSVFFNLIPPMSDPDNGLKFQAYLWRIVRYLDTNEPYIQGILPKNITEWHYGGVTDPEWSGYEGYFKNKNEAMTFIQGLQKVYQDN
jgi:hypothetical protein